MRAILIIISFLFSITTNAQVKEYYLLVGTYTTDVHVYKFNIVNGNAKFVSKISGIENPSYLAITKNGKFIYTVNENHKEKPGEVSALSFDKTKGELHFLNKTLSGGDDPCFIDVDSIGRNIVVANYSGGNLSVFKTNADGSLQPAAQTIDHQGYSSNVVRQSKPHVHCTVFSPDGKYVFSNDLGTDKIYQYQFNAEKSQPLNEDEVVTTDVEDGSGPRHIAFHPNKKYAYVINELSGKVKVFQYDDGKLNEIQTIESDNTGGKDDKGSADIHITPNGQYLYTTNRAKANDIAIYRVQSNGTLVLIGHQSALGIHPRNFVIDPTGKYLLVANRDTNNIVVFTIIKATGFLEPNGQVIQVEKPVCLKFTYLN